MNVLKVDKINKTLAGKQVLFDVSFDVKAGEIYGYL
jgi:ABC-type multidrug transport system ATPase subunit